MHDVPYGYCECGCGRKTNLAQQNDPRRGHLRNEPVRYITGHVQRQSATEYTVENRGYVNSCWIWQLATDRKGYGHGWDGERVRRAHQIYFERWHGRIESGLEIDHLCGQRACVNPEHLEAVTHSENVRRGRSSKLTTAVVANIRLRLAAGDRQADIARDLGVSRSAIYKIAHGKRWKT